MKKVFKQALSFLLVAILIVTVVPLAGLQVKVSAGTNGHSQADAIAWIKARGNENWWQDVDGVNGCQCVDLVKAYYSYLGQTPAIAHAYQYLQDYVLPLGWYRDNTPSPGAIIVWDGNTWTGQWTTGSYGHVGLVYEVSGSNVYTVETNTGGTNGSGTAASAHFRTRMNCNAYYIHPDFPGVIPPGPGPLPKPDRTDPPTLIQRFSYNGRVYEAYASTYTWWQSKSWCENNGGHLATITQPSDQCAINLFVNKYDNLNLFLGAECETTGSWRWIDGTPLSYTYWGAGQPDGNGGTEKFLGTYTNGTWNDFNNSGSGAIWGFILEKDAQDKRNTVSSNLPGVKYSGTKKNGDTFSGYKDAEVMGTEKENMFSNLGFELYNCSGGIEYSVHLSDKGWTSYSSNGALAGTTGQTTAIEAIKIRLTGEAANKYKIYYRTYVNGKGWYSWTSDNQISGTTGAGLHVSAVQALLVPKVKYSAHVAGIGWTNEVSDGATAGTTGQNKQCEAMYAKLADDSFGDIKYSAHIANVGWGINEEIYNGRWAGSTGLELQMEAMKVSLTGEAAKRFDVFYRAHIENDGWSGYVTNGTIAGTTGQDKQLEAFEIKVRPKGSSMTDNVPGYNSYAEGSLGTKTLTFNANGGSYGYTTVHPCTNSEFILYGSVPVKEGYNFAGWYLTPNPTDKDKKYMPYDYIKMSSDITLYAKWETAHVHSYTSEITKPATCAEEGIRTYTCNCGHSYTEPIQKLEHNYTSSVTTEATCVNEGLMTYTCSGCGDKYTESIPATGEHIHSLVETQYPTCTEDGKFVFKCQMCDDSYEEVIPATGHHYDTSEIITEPTCTDEGLIKYTCACGDSFTEPIFAAGHDFESTFVEPTCTERGYSHYVCINCGFSYDDDYVDTIGHTYTPVVTKDASCTEEGVMTYICSCGDSYTEPIPKTEHEYSTSAVITEPTCTEPGILQYFCSCGDSYTEEIPATGHVFGDWIYTVEPTETSGGIREHTCTVCGFTETEDSRLMWDFDEETKTLYIYGSTTIPSCEAGEAPWNSVASAVENVRLGEEIVNIGENAFANCSKLTEVYYLGTAEEWDAVTVKSGNSRLVNANLHCATGGDLTDTIKWRYYEDTKTVIISGTGDIPNYGTNRSPFRDNNNIENVVINNGITSIGDETFHLCRKLKNITIPNSVTSIGKLAFRYCESLKYITIPGSVVTIGSRAFEDCHSLQKILIPDGVTSIGSFAFYYCTQLAEASISGSVTNIEIGIFAHCKNLSKIDVDVNNTVYDSRNNCNAIIETSTNTLVAGCKNTVIPDTVTIIYRYAFYGCSKLTEITIPDSVTSIGEYAFSSCGLTDIDIPESVTFIGGEAFGGCSELTNLFIPKNVITIENGAFDGCSNSLISIDVDEKNPVYDSRKDCNAIIETATNTLICGCKNTVIPNSVTRIGRYAFCNCKSLTSLIIPNNVNSIDFSAFYGCTDLTNITLPDKLTTLGPYAFRGCTGFTEITLPKSLTIIDYYAFLECDALTDVYYCGSVDDWNNININAMNRNLLNGTINIHFLEDADPFNNELNIETQKINEVNYVNGFSLNTTSYNISSLAKDGWNANVRTADSSNRIGTGSVITMTTGNITYEYIAILFGDVNGDGWYDGTDSIIVNCLANGLLSREQVGEAVWLAADCNHDGVIDSADVALLEQAGVILASVDQSKSPEELMTDSAYVEYLNLIDQSPAEEIPVEETPADELVDVILNVFDWLIGVIIRIINYIKLHFSIIK